jgi:hypothetical protein
VSRGWWIRRLEDVPRIAPEEADDPDWYPLQHHFGLTTVGLNAYVARAAGHGLIAPHDETAAGHEELYLVTAGRARFVIDDQGFDVPAGSVAVIRDPTVHRQALALEPGTTVVAVGGAPDPDFESSWQPHHFEGVPRVE